MMYSSPWLVGAGLVLLSCSLDPASGNAVEPGDGYGDAMRWYSQAAAAGAADAQFLYGLRLEKGLGTEPDAAAAQVWFRRAAEQGYAEAQFKLALLLARERGGTADVVALYEAAARQGLNPAQFNLGVVLLNGAETVGERVEALAWISMAAESGLDVAQSLREELASALPATDVEEANRRIDALRQEMRIGRRAVQ